MAVTKEAVPILSSQIAEICAAQTMQCQKFDGMTDSARAVVLDKVCSLEFSRRSETGGVKRRCEILLDSDDDDEDVVNATCPPKRSSTSPIARLGPSTMGNGENNDDDFNSRGSDDSDSDRSGSGSKLGNEELQPVDPMPSEIISNGGVVRGRGQMTIGPVSRDTVRRGKCLTILLRDGGDLKEVVPTVEVTLTANGEYAFKVSTEIEQLYSLDTVPGEWTELNNFPQIARTLFMAAGLQALDPNDLSSFLISVGHEMVWLPPKTGRLELEMHPLELLQHSPALGGKLRATVRADANFGIWARNIADTKRALMEKVVREAGLLIKDTSRTIDLDYFGRFFNRLIAVLPWMEAL